jgi:hypothetical protein
MLEANNHRQVQVFWWNFGSDNLSCEPAAWCRMPAKIAAFAASMQHVSSGPRFASIKIDSANLERVLASRDGGYIVTRIRGALGFVPIYIEPAGRGASQQNP